MSVMVSQITGNSNICSSCLLYVGVIHNFNRILKRNIWNSIKKGGTFWHNRRHVISSTNADVRIVHWTTRNTLKCNSLPRKHIVYGVVCERDNFCMDKTVKHACGHLQLKHFNTALTWPLTHWGRGKMAAISQTTLSNDLALMKRFEFRSRFHWNLFLRVQLTISEHWFR